MKYFIFFLIFNMMAGGINFLNSIFHIFLTSYKVMTFLEYSEDAQFFLMLQISTIGIFFVPAAFDREIMRVMKRLFHKISFCEDLMIVKTIMILIVYLLIVSFSKASVYQLDYELQDSLGIVFKYQTQFATLSFMHCLFIGPMAHQYLNFQNGFILRHVTHKEHTSLKITESTVQFRGKVRPKLKVISRESKLKNLYRFFCVRKIPKSIFPPLIVDKKWKKE